MATSADDMNSTTKRILILASNPAVSEQTGWPIGFWWAELAHPYWEFTQRGYQSTSPAQTVARCKPIRGATPETIPGTRGGPA